MNLSDVLMSRQFWDYVYSEMDWLSWCGFAVLAGTFFYGLALMAAAFKLHRRKPVRYALWLLGEAFEWLVAICIVSLALIPMSVVGLVWLCGALRKSYCNFK